MKHCIIDDILYVNGQSTNLVCSEAEEEFWDEIIRLHKENQNLRLRIEGLTRTVGYALEMIRS